MCYVNPGHPLGLSCQLNCPPSQLPTPPDGRLLILSLSPHCTYITNIHSLCPLLLALISLAYTHSVQCALIQLLRTIVPKPLWLAAAADRGALVTNNNKERDATTWLGTIVWISLGPRKQLLGISDTNLSAPQVPWWTSITTNIRRPHKCKRATNTSPVDTGTRDSLVARNYGTTWPQELWATY